MKLQYRNLTLLEHQSHKLLQQVTPPGGYFTGPNTDPRQYDIPVPDGYVVDNPLDAKAVVEKIGKLPWRRSDC